MTDSIISYYVPSFGISTLCLFNGFNPTHYISPYAFKHQCVCALFFVTGRLGSVSEPSLLTMRAAWSWQNPSNISPCLSSSKSMWGGSTDPASLTVHLRLTLTETYNTFTTEPQPPLLASPLLLIQSCCACIQLLIILPILIYFTAQSCSKCTFLPR